MSSGAACTSGTLAPSPVLLALGLPPERAREAVRFSLGPDNTAEEIDRAAALTATVVARVRAAASLRLRADVRCRCSTGPSPPGGSWWPCPAASIPRPRRRCCASGG